MANEAVRFLRGTWTNYWKIAPTQDASTKKYNYSQAATNYKDCIYFCITGGSTLTADIKNAGVILLNCAPYTLNEDELKTYIETVKLNVNNGLSKITETSGESIKFTPLLFADQDKDASANIITKNDIITNILYTGGKNIYANVNNAALYLQRLNAYTSIYAGNTITIGGLGNTISATTTGAEYKYYRKMSASSTIDKGIVYDIDNLKIYSELHESNGKTAYINLNNNSDITLSSGKSIKNIAPNILFNFGTSYSSAPNYVDLRPNNDISVYTQRTLGISSYDSSISVSHNLVANISTATIGTTNMAVNTSKGSVAFNDYTGTSISGTQLTLSSTKTAANNTTNNPNVVLKLKNNKTTGINFNDDFVMTYDHDTSSMVLHHGNDIFTKIKKESVNNAWYNSILPNGNVRIGSNSNYFNDGAFLELHSARSISTRWDAYDSNEFVTKSAVESVLPTLGSMRHKGIITIDTYATKLSGKHFVGDSYIVSGDIDAIGGKNGDIIVANDVALENSSSANEFTDSTYVAAHWNLIRLVNSDVIMHDGDNKNETWTSGTVPIVTGTDKINKSPVITDSSYSVLQSVSGSSTYVISGKSGSSSSSTLFNNTGNAKDIHDKLIPTLGILDYYKNKIVSDATSAYMQFPKYVLNNYTSGNPTNYLTANRNTMGYIYEAPNTGNSGAAPNTAVHYGNTQSTKNVSLNKARIFAIAGKSGANDSSYMSGIINTDNKWFVTTSLHDYRDSYEVGTSNNIYITSTSGTYYKNLTVFDNNVSIPNYDITNNSLSGVEKIIIAGNSTSNEFISYRSGGQKLYLPKPSNIDKNITNTFVISQDISTMATQTWVGQNFTKKTDLSGYATESWVSQKYLPLSGGRLSGTVSFSNNIGISGIMGGGTDGWGIVGTGDNDNGRLKIYVTDNATTDWLDFEFRDNTGTIYTPLSMTGNQIIFNYNPTVSGHSLIHTGNISSQSVASATKDSDGNQINTTYLKRSGGTLSGNLIIGGSDIPEVSDNLSKYASAHSIKFYRNGFLIPYQMDNSNDGGFFRVRGTSESSTICEIGTWDDFGTGETIQFNYYPTSSTINPTYSVSVPKATGTLALTSGNVASATKLQTARTLWGQSFDGSANVSGNMTGVGTISASGDIGVTKSSGATIVFASNNNGKIGIVTDTNRGVYDYTKSHWLIGTNGTNSWLDVGNVGIGTSNPTEKLDVVGNVRVSCIEREGLIIKNLDRTYSVIKFADSTDAGKAAIHYFHADLQNKPTANTLNLNAPIVSLGYWQNPTVYVNSTNKFVGIGTINPSQALDVNGTIHATTGIYTESYVSALGQNTSSDKRLKDIKGDIDLSVGLYANAPSKLFEWKDNKALGEQVGTIAQYWQRELPQVVHDRGDGYLSMQYDVTALLGTITIAKMVQNHEERIKKLEQENEALREQLKELKG